MKDKLYHSGIRGKVSRSTLADANEKRDWRIYRDFANFLIRQTRQLFAGEDFEAQLDQTVYALDGTIIDLFLSVFPWAKFRKAKGAVKLHTLFDLRGAIPTFVSITDGKVHEVNIYMAFGCQGKNLSHRSEVARKNIYSVFCSDSFANDSLVPSFVFGHRRQDRLSVSAPNIYRN